MWYMNYYIFIIIAVLFLLIALWKETNTFWNILSGFISSFFWLIISLGQMEIDFPYTAIDSTDTIVTGTWTYTDPLSPFFVYLFFGLFVVLQVYGWVMVFDFWTSKSSSTFDEV